MLVQHVRGRGSVLSTAEINSMQTIIHIKNHLDIKVGVSVCVERGAQKGRGGNTGQCARSSVTTCLKMHNEMHCLGYHLKQNQEK